MTDVYLILAPVLLLGVVALLRFIGCTSFGAAAQPSPPAPVPTITSISPESVTAGGPVFTLTVNGTGFVSEDVLSVVQWNGVGKYTTFFDATKLTATIPASDIATAGKASVTVFTPPSGGGTSNAKDVTINPVSVPVPAPVTVTFDGVSPPPGTGIPNSPLDGIYKNLNFGAGVWFWQAAPSHSIFIGPPGSAASTFGGFSFQNGPRVLKSVRVFTQVDGAKITLKDGVNLDISATINIADGPKTINTGWAIASGTVTVTSSVGWDLLIDTITYQGPP